MPEVRFEEEEYQRTSGQDTKASALTRLVLSSHLAKDEAGAQKVLLAIAVVCLVITAWFIFR